MRGERFEEFMAQRVALITGGGKRIGAATVSLLLDNGWFVFIHVRSSITEAEGILRAYEQKAGSKPSAEIIRADFQEDEQLERFIAEVKTSKKVIEANGICALIHNASFYKPKDIEDISLDDLRLMNRIHIEVPFLLTQALIPQLKSVKGSVIGIVDTSLGRSWVGLSHYTSSKAGLRQLMMNFAGELAPEIRVNCSKVGLNLNGRKTLKKSC